MKETRPPHHRFRNIFFVMLGLGIVMMVIGYIIDDQRTILVSVWPLAYALGMKVGKALADGRCATRAPHSS